MDADVAEDPLGRLQLHHAQRVVEAAAHGTATDRLRDRTRDVVADDGECGRRWAQVAGHAGPEGRVRTAHGPVHLLEGPSDGRPHLNAVHDRVAGELRQESGGAFVGWGNGGWLHPDAGDLEIVLPEGCVDGQDLFSVDAADGST